MRKASIFILFLLLACSKDAAEPEEPEVTKFTLVVTASEGGAVDISGGSYNQNSNVSITAIPAEGYVFTGWTGNASGSTNPLSVTMNGNKNITATFSRSQYSLNVNVVGEGSVAQELVSSAKSKTDYDSGSTVRLTATPEAGWLFYEWEGLSTGGTTEEAEVNSTNPIDVAMNQTVNSTAIFEQKITETDNPTNAVGKWKIRKKSTSSKSDKTTLVDCDITEIIFRTDGSFSIITSTTTITGQFVFDGNTTINLTQSSSPFGTITNLVLTSSFISFSIDLVSGCDDDLDGDRDDDYDPNTDTSSNIFFANNTNKIYFDNNGTCKCPNANVGDVGIFDTEFEITVVDNSTMRDELLRNNAWLCTTLVTDMSGNESAEYGMINIFNTPNLGDFPLTFWDTSNVETMAWMFTYSDFGGDISNWDTSNVRDMTGMFDRNPGFGYSGDISNWNTSKVESMAGMFYGASNFNDDIGDWDTSSVVVMTNMFYGATNFNQDIGDWCVTNITSEPNYFAVGSALTEANKPIWGTCPSD